MSQSPVTTVYSRGRKFLLGRSSSQSLSYFGGPGSDAVIEGPRYGPRRLHHILTLNHGQFGIQAVRFGFKVSFYYGLCFEGCELEWQRTATAAIRITKLDPRKSGKEYPYFGYPDVLPCFPLEIIGQEDASVAEIEEAISNVGWEPAAERVYVVAHSQPDLGVALIEPGADVDIVFEYDTQTGQIRAASQVD
jgi:hypothetical protein